MNSLNVKKDPSDFFSIFKLPFLTNYAKNNKNNTTTLFCRNKVYCLKKNSTVFYDVETKYTVLAFYCVSSKTLLSFAYYRAKT